MCLHADSRVQLTGLGVKLRPLGWPVLAPPCWAQWQTSSNLQISPNPPSLSSSHNPGNICKTEETPNGLIFETRKKGGKKSTKIGLRTGSYGVPACNLNFLYAVGEMRCWSTSIKFQLCLSGEYLRHRKGGDGGVSLNLAIISQCTWNIW